MITLDAVTKRYGGTIAVKDIHLTATRNQTTVLLGRSGSGKSTLLRLMNGLLSPSAGRVVVDDVPLTETSLRMLRHRMGYVIQEGGLFPHLTGYANAALLAQHVGWSDARIASRIQDLTDLVRLAPDRLEQFPSELSGGQRQRVSLMRALMLDPDVLLLDEPLGALDPMIRTDLQVDLRSIFRRLSKTVVLVTHDIGEASYLADHVVLLREGQIEQQGSMQALVDAPASAFVSAFIQAQRAPLSHLTDTSSDTSPE